MEHARQWVLLIYRLPREPSTPRTTLWRKLRRLGAVQILDGLAGLPLDSRNQEQLEWLADEVIEAGGEASIWIGEPAAAAQEQELVSRLTRAVVTEYQAVIAEAKTAALAEGSGRRRTLARLRRELRRIAQRDYFPPPEQLEAREAVEAMATSMEVAP